MCYGALFALMSSEESFCDLSLWFRCDIVMGVDLLLDGDLLFGTDWSIWCHTLSVFVVSMSCGCPWRARLFVCSVVVM